MEVFYETELNLESFASPVATLFSYSMYPPEVNIAPEKLPKPNRKGSSSNHHFSGASCFTSGGYS